MTPEEVKLKEREIKVEEDKLQFEIHRESNEKIKIFQKFGISITSIISIAAILVASIQYFDSKSVKKAEIEIAKTQKDKEIELSELNNSRNFDLGIADFLMKNEATLFSETNERRTQLLDVLTLTFGDVKVKQILLRLKYTENLAEDSLAKEYLEKLDSKIIDDIQNTIYRLSDENRNLRTSARDELSNLYNNYPREVQNEMFESFRMGNLTYREVLGIMVVLANAKNGWDDQTGILEKIENYKSSDATLNEWRKRAISNYRSDN
ncbi:hypothetical protein [uncultured Algoriphagus sp.]|uniref:hypothetical protein n=1 Tax=uncultured Algoriphagus sp. TaxID=417365 RepID=UPI0030EF8CAC|tara:strand:- start:19223 stop:20017 length:795 start_codon:yes stop_codon:yes gene_type:complete